MDLLEGYQFSSFALFSSSSVFSFVTGSVEYFLNGIPSLSRLPLVSPKVYTLCQNKLFFDNKVLPEFNILYRMKLIALRIFFILSTRDTDTILVQT